MTELPAGWTKVSLGDLGTWLGGATPSKARQEFWQGGEIPWLSPKDMGAEVISSTRDHITQPALQQSPVRMVPPGSVAIVVRSGILEHSIPVGIVPFATTLNQDMKALSPANGVDTRWVAWGLRAYEQEILRTCRKAGTTVASIELPRLMKFSLPLPPLAEQQRIVAALEDHLSRLDEAMRGLLTATSRLARWRMALLNATINGRLPGYQGKWPEVAIGDLAEVGTGATPLRSRRDFYEGGRIPWITSALLNRPYVDNAEQYITDKAITETAAKIRPAGTLLVAMYGEGQTRGRCSELRIAAATNQACAAIVFRKETEERRPWLKLFLEATYEQNRRLASGGVQPNLNLGLIRSIKIPLPPLEVQRAALRDVDAQLTIGSRLHQELTSARRRAHNLRSLILRQALAGGLVPQDVSDEPASELLARIKAEQLKMQVPRARRIRKSADIEGVGA
ncbi:restriction endonuclease subunit S [Micromonospora sp. WMMD558]|uniref:restriction endonuclease subunit S n=1 Tax=Micromonospora sp. WMMD558 TaxID=3403462 RepID=UPI003BF5514A